jgi:hypothetical protein
MGKNADAKQFSGVFMGGILSAEATPSTIFFLTFGNLPEVWGWGGRRPMGLALLAAKAKPALFCASD